MQKDGGSVSVQIKTYGCSLKPLVALPRLRSPKDFSFENLFFSPSLHLPCLYPFCVLRSPWPPGQRQMEGSWWSI